MRTNIEIDDNLMKLAKEISKLRTKKEVVNIALISYIKTHQRKEMLKLFGKVKWDGNLEKMRSN
ncbi:MAG: type II toxin-antitoxin system VapB family antitoxin [Ignavibacteria bacterium]|nr:type II toxin-antitoxin system VapB family antitoxin [Ignavibacteria bacterium]MBK6878824.1 type II toxin-antitoxin system VapB family antitoxin [Ignavibacteria bacterium]